MRMGGTLEGSLTCCPEFTDVHFEAIVIGEDSPTSFVGPVADLFQIHVPGQNADDEAGAREFLPPFDPVSLYD